MEVNEGSLYTLTARFWGDTNAAITPAAARWRLRDITNNRLLQDWTSLTISTTSVAIAVSPTLNAIYDDSKPFQTHALSVEAEPGTSNQYTEECVYRVKNLSAFT